MLGPLPGRRAQGCQIQHPRAPDPAFGLVALPQVLSPLFIRLRNSRRFFFARSFAPPGFASLPPLAPPVVTRLRSVVPVSPGLFSPRLACATMAALTSAGRLAVSFPGRSPAFTAFSFPDLLPPPTQPLPAGLCVVAPHWSTPLRRSRLRQSPTGSPSWLCCIVFTFVAVDQVLSVALHPASRRRGYFQFSPAQRWQMAGVSHPGGACSFTAHEGSAPSLP